MIGSLRTFYVTNHTKLLVKEIFKTLQLFKKEVNKDYLPKIIDQIEERKIIGVNVTIPYKKDIFNLLVNLDKCILQQSCKYNI